MTGRDGEHAAHACSDRGVKLVDSKAVEHLELGVDLCAREKGKTKNRKEDKSDPTQKKRRSERQYTMKRRALLIRERGRTMSKMEMTGKRDAQGSFPSPSMPLPSGITLAGPVLP